MVVSVCVWSDREAQKYIPLVLSGIKTVLEEGMDISRYLSITVKNSPENTEEVELYFDQAKKRKGIYGLQYKADDVLALYAAGHEGIGVIVTGKDLFAPDTNFVYGVATPLSLNSGRINATILFSSCRIEKWYGNFVTKIIYKTAVHETAHIFNVPSREDEVDYSLGKHCIRVDCVMGQSNVVRSVKEKNKLTKRFVDAKELTEKALARMEATGSPFCSRCREDLIKNKKILIDRLFNGYKYQI